MNTSGKRRSGFTLTEVLVTVAIVAVLAAIVVPTVTSQMGKGDESRLATTTANLRTGITAFVTDTRKFPGRLSDLFSKPANGDDDLFASDYGAAATGKWKGPYGSTTMALTDSLPASLGFFRNTLKDSAFTGTSGFVVITISGVYDSATAVRIDSLIDGGGGATPGATGNLRWGYAGATFPAIRDSSLKFILMGSR
jgi:prepilin-type N-terminal cleavage/methylation domain-containing protein